MSNISFFYLRPVETPRVRRLPPAADTSTYYLRTFLPSNCRRQIFYVFFYFPFFVSLAIELTYTVIVRVCRLALPSTLPNAHAHTHTRRLFYVMACTWLAATLTAEAFRLPFRDHTITVVCTTPQTGMHVYRRILSCTQSALVFLLLIDIIYNVSSYKLSLSSRSNNKNRTRSGLSYDRGTAAINIVYGARSNCHKPGFPVIVPK